MSHVGDAARSLTTAAHQATRARERVAAARSHTEAKRRLLAAAFADTGRPDARAASASVEACLRELDDVMLVIESAASSLRRYVADVLVVGQVGGQELDRAPDPYVDPRDLAPHEREQAEEIVRHRRSSFIGVAPRDFAGIDGHLGGRPVSLKTYSGSSPGGVLHRVATAERSARNAGYRDVDLYVRAPHVDRARLLDFAAGGPMVEIPAQGIIREIHVQTAEGWVRFPEDARGT